jgi:hypothetical protein
MKLEPLSLALLGICGILSLGTATAQEPKSSGFPPETISTATPKSEPLRPGKSFSFLVTLDREPHDYEGAVISGVFHRESGPAPRIRDRYEEDPNSLPASATIHDGQRIYLMTVYLPAWTPPGKWKLNELSVSRRGPPEKSVS